MSMTKLSGQFCILVMFFGLAPSYNCQVDRIFFQSLVRHQTNVRNVKLLKNIGKLWQIYRNWIIGNLKRCSGSLLYIHMTFKNWNLILCSICCLIQKWKRLVWSVKEGNCCWSQFGKFPSLSSEEVESCSSRNRQSRTTCWMVTEKLQNMSCGIDLSSLATPLTSHRRVKRMFHRPLLKLPSLSRS